MQVLKFGGTSVATSENIKLIRQIVINKASGGQLFVVVSAFSGITNKLTDLARMAEQQSQEVKPEVEKLVLRHHEVASALLSDSQQEMVKLGIDNIFGQLKDTLHGVSLVGELTLKMMDKILSCGELLSSLIISAYFNEEIDTTLLEAQEIIVTDSAFGDANVLMDKTKDRLITQLEYCKGVTVCPGFIAKSESGEFTTLGRGGSDYSAALLAALLEADHLEIWTDVSGMMTADPRIVPRARVIDNISFEEAMELSHFGAKVIYPPALQPVLQKGIPLLIKNTFRPDDTGTWIGNNGIDDQQKTVKGLTCVSNIALLNLKGPGMVGVPNFSYRLFKALSEYKVNIILITQASSEHTICVGIDESSVKIATTAIETEFDLELQVGKIETVKVQKELCIIALVGSQMKNQVGISGKMFSTLGANGVNVIAIAQGSSERNISVVIEKKHLKKSLNSLHENFFLSEKKRLNLFIIGVGNVGSALITQMENQKEALLNDHNLDIRLVGIANSKTMNFDPEGFKFGRWKEALETGDTMKLEAYISNMNELNLRNSVFIDNTASDNVPGCYDQILKMSTAVVTPNKIACSSGYDSYLQLKETAKKYRTKLLFETNVGAGLPIISTLNDLIKSGDKILEIQAVLSGSLNYIFNTYDGNLTFEKVVKMAVDGGYTEPDPRIDLSGLDVRRKLLILIRESGIPCELEHIKSTSFIPDKCLQAENTESFYAALAGVENQMKAKFFEASRKSTRLKYVASYKDGAATTGLMEIEQNHPFYSLEGKDNIVLFYTNRYKEQPLVIKGAGAGADVTASGIFADIIRVANS